MAKNDGGPAFPHPQGWRRDPEVSDGMTLRDWFAGMAIGAVIRQCAVDISINKMSTTPEQYFATKAYSVADAMIYAGENKNGDR